MALTRRGKDRRAGKVRKTTLCTGRAGEHNRPACGAKIKAGPNPSKQEKKAPQKKKKKRGGKNRDKVPIRETGSRIKSGKQKRG